jgi:hypothetical protein
MNFKTSAANFAHEPTFNCPNCNHEIRLTESLAAALIEETHRHFQEQLASKDAEVARNLELVRREREELGKSPLSTCPCFRVLSNWTEDGGTIKAS